MTRCQLGVSDGCLREMFHPTRVQVTHENFQAETACIKDRELNEEVVSDL